MPEGLIASEPPPHENPQDQLCDVCGRKGHDKSIPFNQLHKDLRSVVEANTSAVGQLVHICPHCIELFSRAKNQIDSHAKIFEETNYVLPTHLRMEADQRFTGRGPPITIRHRLKLPTSPVGTE